MTDSAQAERDAAGQEHARQLRMARGAMALLTLIVCIAALRTPWHSVMSVDNRTYAEMIRGVALTGLPCLPNGPAAEFPELRARFNSVYNGRLCSGYPPLFAYAAQPAFRLDGLRGVIRFNVALLAAIAWLAYRIARRFIDAPLAAAAAGWLSVLSSPLQLMASDASSYTLGIVFALACTERAIASLQLRGARSRVAALFAGLLGGLAIGTQLLVAPMALAAVAMLFALRSDDESPMVSAPRSILRWIPSIESLARGLAATVGLALPMWGLSQLNQVRFGSRSPVSVGACVWQFCSSSGITNQAPSTMLAYAAPVLLWGAGLALTMAIAGRNARARIAVVALFLIALGPSSKLHDHALGLARMAWGFIVDVSDLDMADFWRPADHVGVFLGPWVIRSSMQCAPAIALALAVRFRNANERRVGALIATVVAALYASLILRAPISTIYALGFPFVSLRYVSPAVPLLLLLAVAAVRGQRWDALNVAFVAAIALFVVAWLWRSTGDGGHVRRLFLLRALPITGFVALALRFRTYASASRHWESAAMTAATLAFAFGVGATMGVDLHAVSEVRGGNDRRLDAIARQTPDRLALVGWPIEIDTVLALRSSRDVVYADLFESTSWTNFRTLIDRWSAESRPIFALWPNDTIQSPWNDVVFEPVDAHERLFRVRLRAPAP